MPEMKVHSKINWEKQTTMDSLAYPTFQQHVCPRCHHVTAIQEEHIDWHRVADEYKAAYEGMSEAFTETMKKAETVFDVPIMAWLAEERSVLLAKLTRLQDRFRANDSGEEWKHGLDKR
jgi:UDP-N-acetylmuramoylalanine-D-glutamate ligase